MTTSKSILPAIALSGLFLTANTAASLADGIRTFKPAQGVTFQAGAKRAVGYFTNETGRCKLVLTLADEPAADEQPGFTTIRHEVTLQSGEATRYAQDGQTFEFGCQAGAHNMTFKPLQRFAEAG